MNRRSTHDLLAHRSSAARAGLGVSIDRQRRCSISRSPFRSRFVACSPSTGCPVALLRGPSDSADRFGRRRRNPFAVGVPRARRPQPRDRQPRAAPALVHAPDTLVDNLRLRCRWPGPRLAPIARCAATDRSDDRCAGSARHHPGPHGAIDFGYVRAACVPSPPPPSFSCPPPRAATPPKKARRKPSARPTWNAPSRPRRSSRKIA